jgi:hypothetical protein
VVQAALEKSPEAPLDVFIIWIPAITGDDYGAAMGSLSKVPDPRARHYWDGGQALGEAFSPLLGIRSRMAWDVYLLFDGKAQWKDSPPAPTEWLHQLVGEDPDRKLSLPRLEEEIAKILR